MQQTIKTPHDVVQILIDIIATHENKFAIYTKYYKQSKAIRVSIVTRKYLYDCLYDLHGRIAEITRKKNHYKVNGEILKACTFKVFDDLTSFVSIDISEVKRKVIIL